MGRMAIRVLMGVMGAAGCLQTGRPANAQDARALLNKTLQTYHNMNAYTGKGAVEVNMAVGARHSTMSALSSEFTYKRPNKVMIHLTSRGANTSVYSDGGRLIVYKEEAQKYSLGPSAPTLSGLLPLLQSRANISAMLDPFYFLSSASLPSALTALKTLPAAKVNGHDTTVVEGVWQGGPPAGQSQNPFCRNGTRWTLYIDKANGLLQKVEARVPAKVNMRGTENGKPKAVTLDGNLVMSYTIIDAASNPAVDDKVFVFTPPKGVTEQKDVNDLLKGGAGAAR